MKYVDNIRVIQAARTQRNKNANQYSFVTIADATFLGVTPITKSMEIGFVVTV